jgi:O-antigen/teichoic acid export membrane protein
MIAYSGWITIGAAAQVGKDTGSQVIINSFFGTILNASFGVANSLNSFVKMFASSISQAAIPQITKSYSVGDHKRTKILVSSITKYSFLLMYLPALPILLETEFILKLWLGDVPVYSVAFCRLMIINGLIDCLITGVPAAAQASGKIKWFQMTMSIVMLLSLPISYMLFDIGYPPFYIIWVYISSSALNVLFSLYLLKRIIRFDIIYLLKKSFLKVLIVFVSTIPLFFIIEVFDSSINRLIIVSLLSSFWLIIIAYFFGLDRHEKKLLSAYVFKRI